MSVINFAKSFTALMDSDMVQEMIIDGKFESLEGIVNIIMYDVKADLEGKIKERKEYKEGQILSGVQDLMRLAEREASLQAQAALRQQKETLKAFREFMEMCDFTEQSGVNERFELHGNTKRSLADEWSDLAEAGLLRAWC